VRPHRGDYQGWPEESWAQVKVRAVWWTGGGRVDFKQGRTRIIPDTIHPVEEFSKCPFHLIRRGNGMLGRGDDVWCLTIVGPDLDADVWIIPDGLWLLIEMYSSAKVNGLKFELGRKYQEFLTLIGEESE
jgi:hypothetical protein